MTFLKELICYSNTLKTSFSVVKGIQGVPQNVVGHPS